MQPSVCFAAADRCTMYEKSHKKSHLTTFNVVSAGLDLARKFKYLTNTTTIIFGMMKIPMRHFWSFFKRCVMLLPTITWFYQMQSGMKKDLLLSNLF